MTSHTPEQDAVTRAWLERLADPAVIPRPEIIIAARRLADDDRLVRLVRQVALEKRLLYYAHADRFLWLVEKVTGRKRSEHAESEAR